MRHEKKAWRTPELVILVRGNAEESVLTACKPTGGTVTPNSSNGNCQQMNMGPCQIRNASATS